MELPPPVSVAGSDFRVDRYSKPITLDGGYSRVCNNAFGYEFQNNCRAPHARSDHVMISKLRIPIVLVAIYVRPGRSVMHVGRSSGFTRCIAYCTAYLFVKTHRLGSFRQATVGSVIESISRDVMHNVESPIKARPLL